MRPKKKGKSWFLGAIQGGAGGPEPCQPIGRGLPGGRRAVRAQKTRENPGNPAMRGRAGPMPPRAAGKKVTPGQLQPPVPHPVRYNLSQPPVPENGWENSLGRMLGQALNRLFLRPLTGKIREGLIDIILSAG